MDRRGREITTKMASRMAKCVCHSLRDRYQRWPHVRCLQGTLTYPPPPLGEDEEEKPADKYEGHMEHGKRQGKGRYTWGNGCYYDGEYAENKKHGTGVITFPDKGSYEGGDCAVP
jgi:hypothetical protein